jgi:hypothetical protein
MAETAQNNGAQGLFRVQRELAFSMIRIGLRLGLFPFPLTQSSPLVVEQTSIRLKRADSDAGHNVIIANPGRRHKEITEVVEIFLILCSGSFRWRP